jgi:effector-binding domain-containing protein
MTAVVRVEQSPGIPLAVVRRQARQSELSRVVPECCRLVWNVVRAQQAKAGRNVAPYWDCVDGELTIEVGVEMAAPFAEQHRIIRSATPAGEVASATHFGPYSGLGAAHAAITQWCRANNRKPAGPSWEVYGHWRSEWDRDPWQIRTDVYYLLADA